MHSTSMTRTIAPTLRHRALDDCAALAAKGKVVLPQLRAGGESARDCAYRRVRAYHRDRYVQHLVHRGGATRVDGGASGTVGLAASQKK